MSERKKILILSCHGGGGHMSSANAIAAYLAQHDVKIVDFIGDTLAHLDPLFYLSGKKYTGQDCYNFLLQRNYKRTINALFHVGLFLINMRKSILHFSTKKFFAQEKPDIIISVIPLINDIIAQTAAEHNVPCFIVPTDFDTHTFIHNIDITNSNTRICLPINYPEITKRLSLKSINNLSNVRITGFPVRPSFLIPKDKSDLKKDFSIYHEKPIMLLVMGATGSSATIDYLKMMVAVNVPFHVMACIGRSNCLKEQIEALQFPEHITVTIVDHTKNIADVMAIADFAISKPGSVTFAEMLYMNLPMLLDNTTPALLWEQMNLDLVRTYQLGGVIQDYDEVAPLVTRYLTNERYRHTIKKNIEILTKPNFATSLQVLLNEAYTPIK